MQRKHISGETDWYWRIRESTEIYMKTKFLNLSALIPMSISFIKSESNIKIKQVAINHQISHGINALKTTTIIESTSPKHSATVNSKIADVYIESPVSDTAFRPLCCSRSHQVAMLSCQLFFPIQLHSLLISVQVLFRDDSDEPPEHEEQSPHPNQSATEHLHTLRPPHRLL